MQLHGGRTPVRCTQQVAAPPANVLRREFWTRIQFHAFLCGQTDWFCQNATEETGITGSICRLTHAALVQTIIEFYVFYAGGKPSNRYWIDQFNMGAIDSYPSGELMLGSLLGNEASIRAVTPGDIQETARRYFDMDNRVRVTLLPAESN